jgi:Domain of unknown function (DUF4234)
MTEPMPAYPRDPQGVAPHPMPAPTYAPAPYPWSGPVGYPPGSAPVGTIRSTGLCILLAVVTFGIYQLVWAYRTHAEIKRHTGDGLGGPLALVLTLFVGIAMPYLTSSEVGTLYARRGQARPVSGLTGLWYFPGAFLIVGPLVWFIKTNGALNAYWRSLGAR